MSGRFIAISGRLALLLATTACAPEAVQWSTCLDADADGICDRERADWSIDAAVPLGTDRANIYQLAPDDLRRVRAEGVALTHDWPVSVSGLLLPRSAMSRFLTDEPSSSTHATSLAFARELLGFGTLSELATWLTLPPWPTEAELGFPLAAGVQPGDPMGMGSVPTHLGDALSFSCATCHASDLFGHTVVGLTNRTARANEFFVLAQSFFPGLDPALIQSFTDADDAEMAMFVRAQQRLGAVGAKRPEVRGLDTSLAQVALSLARRADDEHATRDRDLQLAPRANPLSTLVADSKPAVWWTLKHKTRWLSDGSIVSGNPIHTNFLWNELGRGTDMPALERWLDDNGDQVDALTVAVFATEAPRWLDILGADALDLDAAMRGEAIFLETCASCHGTYQKGWSDASNATLADATLADLLATTSVVYHAQTPTFDVSTDRGRADGMAHFLDGLNNLAISQAMNTTVSLQTGYVPPPLDGIWARYPYLHNGSVPTLCDLLSPPDERTAVFWIGPSSNASTDFDADCVGFPTGDATPASWTTDADRRHDTSLPGLSNRGHDEMLLDASGNWLLSGDARADLIAFLKTL